MSNTSTNQSSRSADPSKRSPSPTPTDFQEKPNQEYGRQLDTAVYENPSEPTTGLIFFPQLPDTPGLPPAALNERDSVRQPQSQPPLRAASQRRPLAERPANLTVPRSQSLRIPTGESTAHAQGRLVTNQAKSRGRDRSKYASGVAKEALSEVFAKVRGDVENDDEVRLPPSPRNYLRFVASGGRDRD